MRESKLSALRLILEFGDTQEKKKAKSELFSIAYGSSVEQIQPEVRQEQQQLDLESSSDDSILYSSSSDGE